MGVGRQRGPVARRGRRSVLDGQGRYRCGQRIPRVRGVRAGNARQGTRQQHLQPRALRVGQIERRLEIGEGIQLRGVLGAGQRHVELAQVLLQVLDALDPLVRRKQRRAQVDAQLVRIIVEACQIPGCILAPAAIAPGHRQEHDRELQALAGVHRQQLHAARLAFDAQLHLARASCWSAPSRRVRTNHS